MSHSSMRFYPAWLGTALAAAGIIGCGGGDGITTPPPPPPPAAPIITSINPTSAFRDATLDVHVIGSGFDQGSRVVFASTKLRTNSTNFVSATELLANVTIAADAPDGPYGVQVVTSGGKQSTVNFQFGVRLQVELVDLGAGDYSGARGVNNAGKIVGFRSITQRAFLWDNGTFTDLGVLPGMTFSFAFDINNNDQVVGVSGTGTDIDNATSGRAFIWSAAGGMQALSTLGGTGSSTRAINDNGDIAGSAGTVFGTGHAVVWRNGVISDLQAASFSDLTGSTFAISSTGEAVGYVYGQGGFRSTVSLPMTILAGSGLLIGINTAGCIAGWTTGLPPQGYRLCGAVSRNIGSCGGVGSTTWAINTAGDVVGRASNGVSISGGVQEVAFLWTESGGTTCFPLSQGSNGATAFGVNDNGSVVGEVNRPVGGGRATLWKVK